MPTQALADKVEGLGLARRVAREAGRAAMRYYGSAIREAKRDDSPVTAADRAANDVILDALRAVFPTDAILSEESRDSTDRLSTTRLWIVDPLDGTKEFLAQNGEFSIMIGLVEDGEPVLGVVYLPDGDVMYSAEKGKGAWIERDGRRARLQRMPTNGSIRLVGSRSHSEPVLESIQRELGIMHVQPCGSVGVKCGRIADGRRDLYVHPVPYLREWDTCAPEVILREAGGDVTDCWGERLTYNKPNPVQPYGIVACAPGLIDRVVPITSAMWEREHVET